jgi:hypothetical protein
LALELAGRAQKRSDNATWLVYLASVRESASVEQVVATAVGVPERGEPSALPALIDALQNASGLLLQANLLTALASNL